MLSNIINILDNMNSSILRFITYKKLLLIDNKLKFALIKTYTEITFGKIYFLYEKSAL